MNFFVAGETIGNNFVTHGGLVLCVVLLIQKSKAKIKNAMLTMLNIGFLCDFSKWFFVRPR